MGSAYSYSTRQILQLSQIILASAEYQPKIYGLAEQPWADTWPHKIKLKKKKKINVVFKKI